MQVQEEIREGVTMVNGTTGICLFKSEEKDLKGSYLQTQIKAITSISWFYIRKSLIIHIQRYKEHKNSKGSDS